MGLKVQVVQVQVPESSQSYLQQETQDPDALQGQDPLTLTGQK